MYTIIKENVNEVPIIHVINKGKEMVEVPLIVFYHGYTGEKEYDLHYAYRLAERGYRVILPDAPYHGEREGQVSFDEREMMFWDIVIQSIHELGSIVKHFKEQGLVVENRVAVAGVSMGGITALGAVKHYPWLTYAASLMGTPCYVKFATAQINKLKNARNMRLTDQEIEQKLALLRQYDMTEDMTSVEGKKLFFWHGKKDTVVPFDGVEAFSTQLSSKDVTYYFEDEAEHSVTKEGMKQFYRWVKETV
ncbi:MAG: alpha/beta hydrolase [Bacillaceae bacterium]|nr:alpha/beta hydrolase [Bacillaceae bacterium]